MSRIGIPATWFAVACGGAQRTPTLPAAGAHVVAPSPATTTPARSDSAPRELVTSAAASQPASTPAANGSPSSAAFDSPACERAARDLAQAAAGAWHAKLGDVLARPRSSTGQERAVYRFDFYALATGKDIAPYRASEVMGLGSIDVDPSSGGIELHCVARLDCSAWDEPEAQPAFAELRARVVSECGRPGRAEPAFGAPARAAERARHRDST